MKATNPTPFWLTVDWSLMGTGGNGLIGDTSFSSSLEWSHPSERIPNWRNSDSCSVVDGKGELLTKITVKHSKFIIGRTEIFNGRVYTTQNKFTDTIAPLSSNYLTIRVKADQVNLENTLDFTAPESVYFKGPCELKDLNFPHPGDIPNLDFTFPSEWISSDDLPDEITLKTIEYEPESWLVLAGVPGEYYRLENRSDKTWRARSTCTWKLEARRRSSDSPSEAQVHDKYSLWIERGSMHSSTLVNGYGGARVLPQQFVEFNIYHLDSSSLTTSRYLPCIDPVVWFKEAS